MAGVPARVYRIPAVRNSDLREFIVHSQQKSRQDAEAVAGRAGAGRQSRSARAWSPAHVSAFLKRIHPPEPWKAGEVAVVGVQDAGMLDGQRGEGRIRSEPPAQTPSSATFDPGHGRPAAEGLAEAGGKAGASTETLDATAPRETALRRAGRVPTY